VKRSTRALDRLTALKSIHPNIAETFAQLPRRVTCSEVIMGKTAVGPTIFTLFHIFLEKYSKVAIQPWVWPYARMGNEGIKFRHAVVPKVACLRYNWVHYIMGQQQIVETKRRLSS
jgi:hypothetical protein